MLTAEVEIFFGNLFQFAVILHEHFVSSKN